MLNDLFSIEPVKSKERGRTIDRVIQRMLELGWDQAEFARKMGVSDANVTNWKARGMPTDHLERASRVLGKSVDWLLGKEDSTRKQIFEWPFEVPFSDFEELEDEQQQFIRGIVEDQVARYKAQNGPKRRKKSDENGTG